MQATDSHYKSSNNTDNETIGHLVWTPNKHLTF